MEMYKYQYTRVTDMTDCGKCFTHFVTVMACGKGSYKSSWRMHLEALEYGLGTSSILDRPH
jgi:hypothetical protein